MNQLSTALNLVEKCYTSDPEPNLGLPVSDFQNKATTTNFQYSQRCISYNPNKLLKMAMRNLGSDFGEVSSNPPFQGFHRLDHVEASTFGRWWTVASRKSDCSMAKPCGRRSGFLFLF